MIAGVSLRLVYLIFLQVLGLVLQMGSLIYSEKQAQRLREGRPHPDRARRLSGRSAAVRLLGLVPRAARGGVVARTRSNTEVAARLRVAPGR
jgi:hypothetical protein